MFLIFYCCLLFFLKIFLSFLTSVYANTPKYTYDGSFSTSAGGAIVATDFDVDGFLYAGRNTGISPSMQVYKIAPNGISSYQSFAITDTYTGTSNAKKALVVSGGIVYSLSGNGHYYALRTNDLSLVSSDITTNYTGVDKDSSGNIYISRTDPGVFQYNSSLNLVGQVGSIGNLPFRIAHDTFYVLNGTTLSAYDLSGNLGTSNLLTGLPASVSAFHVDPQGYLYMVTSGGNGKIYVYHIDTAQLVATTGDVPTTLTAPFYNIIVSPDGQYLYVCGTKDSLGVLQRFRISYKNSFVSSLVHQGLIPESMASAMLAGTTKRVESLNSMNEGQLKELVTSISYVPQNSSTLAEAAQRGVGGVVLSMVTSVMDIASIHHRSSIPKDSFQMFTDSQQTKFLNLSQQLPFFQFQPLQMITPSDRGQGRKGYMPYGNKTIPFEKAALSVRPTLMVTDQHHAWLQPYGGIQRLDSYDQVTGYTLKTFGTAMGLGKRVIETFTIGVLMGAASNTYTEDKGMGTGDITNFYGGIYGGYDAKENGFHTHGSAIVGRSHYSVVRSIPSINLLAQNDHKGWDGATRLLGGYKMYIGDYVLDPFVSVGFRYSYQNGYQETGADPFNLKVSSSTSKTGLVEAGIKFQRHMFVGETMVKPFVSLSTQTERPLITRQESITSFSDNSGSFGIPVTNQTKTFGVITVGCVSMFTNNISVSSIVNGRMRRHERSGEALVKLGYSFK